MARGLDSPLIFDRACLVYAHIGGGVQSYKVVVLRILNAIPCDLNPLSALPQQVMTCAQLYNVVKSVSHVANLELLKRIMHVMIAAVLSKARERRKEYNQTQRLEHAQQDLQIGLARPARPLQHWLKRNAQCADANWLSKWCL